MMWEHTPPPSRIKGRPEEILPHTVEMWFVGKVGASMIMGNMDLEGGSYLILAPG